MAALPPAPNIGSQIERAVLAYLFVAFSGASGAPNFYFSNDWKKRVTPLISALAHKSTEEIKNQRVESYMLRLEAEWPGVNQPGQTNPDYNWVSVNNLIGTVMAAMSQTDNNADSYKATAIGITIAGRKLAALGTAAVTGATADDLANNSDMADFYCDYVEFKGSQRAEVTGDGLYLKEIRNFEVRACNIKDDSVFPALSFDGTDTLNWTFTDGPIAEPAYWVVQKSVDGLNWTVAASEASGARSYNISGSGTQYWRVYSSNDGANLLYPESNIVKATA